MKYLTTSTDAQTLTIIPRVYTTDVVITLRNDSTNDLVTVILPTSEIIGNYIVITNIFSLTESNFYDLKVYEVKGSYKDFKDRVIADSGTFENNTCLYNELDALNLINQSDLDIIYRDRIFCTSQTIDQSENEYYSVNENEYISKSADNDFIIL